jgi:hypothetical protein
MKLWTVDLRYRPNWDRRRKRKAWWFVHAATEGAAITLAREACEDARAEVLGVREDARKVIEPSRDVYV